jgi:hypothetical protein
MTWQPFQQLVIGSNITYTNNLPYHIQGVRIKTLSLELDGQLVTLAQSQAVCLFSLSEENGQSDNILNDTFSLYPDNDYLIFSLNSNFFNSPRIGFKILDEFLAQSPQWTIEIELYQFSNLSSISDILQFINGNTNNKIQLVLNALQNLDLSGLTNMDFTQLLADISTLLTDSNTQLLADINTALEAENNGLLTDINAHADSNKTTLLTDINAHADSNKTTLLTDINAHADSNKTTLLTDINAHADSNKDLIITAINGINTGGGGTTPPPEPLKYYLKADSFNDESTYNRILVNTGVTLDSSNKKYGSSSFYFNGNAKLDIPANDIYLGTEDFCLEMFARFQGGDYGNIITLTSSWAGLIYSDGDAIYLSDNWAIYNNISDYSKFYHLALTKEGSTIRFFLDGVNIFQENINLYFLNYSHRLGQSFVNDNKFNGWIDSLRLETGTAKYTTNFNPETDTNLAY